MNIIKYLEKNGIKRSIQVLYRYKIDLLERKIISLLFNHFRLLNVIVIESHNDFDCNGGALYDYLVNHEYTKKYRIVWLLKNSAPSSLPYNVVAFQLHKPSIIKNYYICRAKYLFADHTNTPKVRKDQICIYQTHGGITFKNVKGRVNVPAYVDYVLSPSEEYDPIMCKNYSIPYPNDKMLHVGMPKNDVLFNNDLSSEIKKIRTEDFSKIILWMPTFRKIVGESRNDSTIDYPLGIPLFQDVKQLKKINEILYQYNSLLILKLHPSQDLSMIAKIPNFSNIEILSDTKTKDMAVNIYRLMRCADAMISDYSSSAYSYLLLNKPIAFILSDIQEYKLGFNVDDYKKILPGNKINSVDDFLGFIIEIFDNVDQFEKQRIELLGWLYKYHDGSSCKRLVEFLGL